MAVNNLILVGYSGHGYVCLDIAKELGYSILGYCDKVPKDYNPFELEFLGDEMNKKLSKIIQENSYFVGIGNNTIRNNIIDKFSKVNNGKLPISLISERSTVSSHSLISTSGVLINAGAVINAFATIKSGVIVNSSCIIEHECVVEAYAHIAPGAVLAGNVQVGERSFVGANSVIVQGVQIGRDVTIGAGAVILKDVPDGSTVVGNPGRIINKDKL